MGRNLDWGSMMTVRLLLLSFSLLSARNAYAVRRVVMEGLPAGSNTVMVSTINVRFGVAMATPTATLDVRGDARFGSAAAGSTFTSTGHLTPVSGFTIYGTSTSFSGGTTASVNTSTSILLSQGGICFGSVSPGTCQYAVGVSTVILVYDSTKTV